MKSRRTLFLLLLTLMTLVLGAVAVVTSLHLKEMATVPVTPNVPVSQPRAATSDTPPAVVCQTEFTVAALACEGACTVDSDCGTGLFCDTNRNPKVCAKQICSGKPDPCDCSGSISCVAKEAFKDAAGNSAGTYSYTDKLAANSDVARDQTVVYRISYKNTSAAPVTGVTITDVVPGSVTFKDAESGCTYTASNRTVTCTVGDLAGNATGTKAFRVTVNGSAEAGSFTNTASVKAGTESSDCAVALKVNVPGAPKCNDECDPNNTSSCPSNTKCIKVGDKNLCRNEKCTGETDCTCAPKCNDYCANDSECPSDMKCQENKCRNPKCLGETDCSCPTAAAPPPAPPEEQLPEAGTTLPTVVFLGAGAVLLIIGMLVAGMW